MVVRLIVTGGQHVGRRFEFADHRTFLVGRASDAHLRFPDDDPYISRLHFLLEVNPPQIRLVDLGSTNGTRVNGQTVAERQLRDGDVIEAGETRISVFISRTPAPDRDSVASPKATLISEPPAGDPGGPPRQLSRTEAGVQRTPEPPRAAAGPGEQIAGYRLVKELGRGSFGIVYLARKSSQTCALKLLQPKVAMDDQVVKRFLREIMILRELRHPNLVSFVDAGRETQWLFLVTEYVEGGNLDQILRQRGLLSVRSAVRLIRHALRGLQYAHDRGFVHRDIKPANILVNPKQVKLADFGLAASFQATMLSGCTLGGDSGGSMGFMPPEQLLNFHDATPTNDVYSMGATLYKILTGSLPHDFPKPFSQQVQRLLQADAVPLQTRRRSLPAELCGIVDRCLRREPSQRWSTARDLYEALAPFSRKAAGSAVAAEPGKTGPSRRDAGRPGAVAADLPRHDAQARPEPEKRLAWRVSCSDSGAMDAVPHKGIVRILENGDYAFALGSVLLIADSAGQVRSRYECGARIIGSPATGPDQRLVVHALDGRLHAVSRTGEQLWVAPVGEPLSWATPLVDKLGQIWICSSSGGLLRVSPEGVPDRRPFLRSMQRLDSTGYLEDNSLWLGAEDGRVYAVDLTANKGRNAWSDSDGQGRASWYINGSILKRPPDQLLARSGDGVLHAFSLSGDPVWQWRFPGTVLGDVAVGPQGLVYVGFTVAAEEAGNSRGGLQCFDPDQGRECWQAQIPAAVESTPVLGPQGTVFVGDNSGIVRGLDARGETHFSVQLSAAVRSQLVYDAQAKLLLALSDDATLSAVRAG